MQNAQLEATSFASIPTSNNDTEKMNEGQRMIRLAEIPSIYVYHHSGLV
jgi:hypothetical protein